MMTYKRGEWRITKGRGYYLAFFDYRGIPLQWLEIQKWDEDRILIDGSRPCLIPIEVFFQEVKKFLQELEVEERG